MSFRQFCWANDLFNSLEEWRWPATSDQTLASHCFTLSVWLRSLQTKFLTSDNFPAPSSVSSDHDRVSLSEVSTDSWNSVLLQLGSSQEQLKSHFSLWSTCIHYTHLFPLNFTGKCRIIIILITSVLTWHLKLNFYNAIYSVSDKNDVTSLEESWIFYL